MSGHPRKLLDDGTANPKWKPRPSGHRSAPANTKFRNAQFVAWDGEGITDDADIVRVTQMQERLAELDALIFTLPARTAACREAKVAYKELSRELMTTETAPHRYVLLMASTGDCIVNPEGLSTEQCLELVCKVAGQYPSAVHVVFGGGYDANMMLGDLPKEQIRELWTGQQGSMSGGKVTYKRWELQYTHRKCFQVREWASPPFARNKAGKYVPQFVSSVKLWDVFGFFQSTFVKAVEEWLGADYVSLPTIKAGKARRSQFAAGEIEHQIIPYTSLEVAALVELMEAFRDRLDAAGLHVTRWDGAGACAAALLKRENVKAHMPPREQAWEDTRARAFQHAYAGGRMELMRYGRHEGPIYHYDINSAYPAAICELPSLARGEWENTVRLEPFGVYYVRWRHTGDRELPMYPLFYRTAQAEILFPSEGEGWYWGPEVMAARAAEKQGVRIDVVDGFVWHPADPDARPFAFLPELYQERRRRKAVGDRSEKALKLAYNSCYGKMAQSLGYREDHGIPPYHCLEWAGYVTARTRGTLYAAMMQAPADIVMVATDGIYSTAPLDLPCGPDLGEWEAHEHDELIAVQSGVYWIRDGDHWSEFRRGFDAGSLTREGVLRAWRDGERSYTARSTRFVGMGSALASDELWHVWRRWRSVPKRVRLDVEGTKRKEWEQWSSEGRPDLRLMRTIAEANPTPDVPSAPYPLPWFPGGGEWQTRFVDGVDERVVEWERMEAEV